LTIYTIKREAVKREAVKNVVAGLQPAIWKKLRNNKCCGYKNNAYHISHTYRALEQQSSRAAENPPLNSPFTKGDY